MQHDYSIANQTALSLRGDLNDVLEAVVTNNSGLTAPADTFADMIWLDKTTNIIKLRDETNSSWINLGYIDQGNLKFYPFIGSVMPTAFLDEDDLSSDSATAIPSQQSVKAYVDNLDTTPDGVDFRDRVTQLYTTSGSAYQEFTTFGNASVITVEGQTVNNVGATYIQISFSTDGGSTWGSNQNITSNIGEGGAGFYFRSTVNFEEGFYLSLEGDGNSDTGTFTSRTSSTNAFRIRNSDGGSGAKFFVTIQQGFGS